MIEKMAEAVLLAAKFHEESWNITGDHEITLKAAADMAATVVGFDTRGTMPIYLMLSGTWNESLDWARNALKPTTSDHGKADKPGN